MLFHLLHYSVAMGYQVRSGPPRTKRAIAGTCMRMGLRGRVAIMDALSVPTLSVTL